MPLQRSVPRTSRGINSPAASAQKSKPCSQMPSSSSKCARWNAETNASSAPSGLERASVATLSATSGVNSLARRTRSLSWVLCSRTCCSRPNKRRSAPVRGGTAAERSRRNAQPSVAGRCARIEKTSGAGAESAELTGRQLDQADARRLLGLGEVELRGARHVVKANRSLRADCLLHEVPSKRSVLGQGAEDSDNAWQGDHHLAGPALCVPGLRSAIGTFGTDAPFEGDLDRAVRACLLCDVDVVELAREVVAIHRLNGTRPGNGQVGTWIRVFLVVDHKDTPASHVRVRLGDGGLR